MTDPESIQQQFDLSLRPTWRSYLVHVGMLLLTVCTATIAGVLYPFGKIDIFPREDPESMSEIMSFVASLPLKYVDLIADTVHKLAVNQEGLLVYGLSFSLSLLFILISHEMGHYVACRIYRVDATLPCFIPTPPLIGPAGTFGAFIKIQSPFPSRQAIFDIGVAGPIAGFIALLPIAFIGVLTMQIAEPQHLQMAQGNGISFTDPLLMKIFGAFLGKDLNFGTGNPFYYAAWVGLLVTALNLIPSGQLDGGHAIFAVMGKRVHWWTGRIAFAAMATFSILGWIFYSSPSGFLIAILLGVMMRIRHPEPMEDGPLDGKRKLVAFLTLAIFALCFVPFPIRIS